MYVLIVEDHEDTRVVLSRLLTYCGHDVTTASDYASGCKLLANFRFGALVSDLSLPDGDGLELVIEAKKHQALIAIALTARGNETEQVAARTAGFDHFIQKPFDFHKLRNLLAA